MSRAFGAVAAAPFWGQRRACHARVRAEKGVGPFLPTRVAPLFGPRGVAKLVRSTAACGEMGTPQPHQACAWLSLRSSENWQQRGIRELFNSLLGASSSPKRPSAVRTRPLQTCSVGRSGSCRTRRAAVSRVPRQRGLAICSPELPSNRTAERVAPIFSPSRGDGSSGRSNAPETVVKGEMARDPFRATIRRTDDFIHAEGTRFG